MLKLEFFK